MHQIQMLLYCSEPYLKHVDGIHSQHIFQHTGFIHSVRCFPNIQNLNTVKRQDLSILCPCQQLFCITLQQACRKHTFNTLLQIQLCSSKQFSYDPADHTHQPPVIMDKYLFCFFYGRACLDQVLNSSVFYLTFPIDYWNRLYALHFYEAP